jgi:hypothetical protein
MAIVWKCLTQELSHPPGDRMLRNDLSRLLEMSGNLDNL